MRSVVVMKTSLGTLYIKLFASESPEAVANFLRYVEDQFYHGSLFHRVIPEFMIQGGGYTSGLRQKTSRPSIRNESGNGLHNERGTISMARKVAYPDSATSQFFINLEDNLFLDRTPDDDQSGQCVFGQVSEGMEVADAIASVETESRAGHHNVPVRDVTIDRVWVVQIDPVWLGWNEGTPKKLAKAIRDECRFEALPVLADALEEAGCTDSDILSHLRKPESHVRGCWVVDLILGQS